jgi:hypothetical protein
LKALPLELSWLHPPPLELERLPETPAEVARRENESGQRRKRCHRGQ